MSSLTSQSFIKRLIQEDYKFFTGVPCSLLSGLIYELEDQQEARYIPAVREDAAVGLCTGAYLSGAYTPLWVENMTAGRGWIALALVVFASWKPWRAFFGAYLFGGVTIVQLYAQGMGVEISAPFLSMLPYLATILVLVLISRDTAKARLNAPACLGKNFHASGQVRKKGTDFLT